MNGLYTFARPGAPRAAFGAILVGARGDGRVEMLHGFGFAAEVAEAEGGDPLPAGVAI